MKRMGERGAGAADANAVQLGLRCVKGMGKRGAGASDANAVQLTLRCVKRMGKWRAPRMRLQCSRCCGVNGGRKRDAGAADVRRSWCCGV